MSVAAGESEVPGRYVWQLPLRPARVKGVDGAVLAALRRGIGREPGTVPEMWPYYRELNDSGKSELRLNAEHLTMALFAVHQQSRTQPVHRPNGPPVGAAVGALRASGRFSEEAVDRRFSAFATATSLTEAGVHLRGLITQLREIEDGQLDYTSLFNDLVTWQEPELRGRVRRRWGRHYFAPSSAETTRKENS